MCGDLPSQLQVSPLIDGLVFIFPELSLFWTTLIFVCIQFLYMLSHFIIRPMKEVKDQLLEMVNELIYVTLIIILFFWREEKHWSEFKTNAYIWIMVGNIIVF